MRTKESEDKCDSGGNSFGALRNYVTTRWTNTEDTCNLRREKEREKARGACERSQEGRKKRCVFSFGTFLSLSFSRFLLANNMNHTETQRGDFSRLSSRATWEK